MTKTRTMETETAGGSVKVTVRGKGCLPQELSRLLTQAGFLVDHIWGRPITLDEVEMMVVSHGT